MLPPWSGDEVPYSWPTLQLPATQMGNSDGLYRRISFFQECLAGPLPHAAKQHKRQTTQTTEHGNCRIEDKLREPTQTTVL